MLGLASGCVRKVVPGVEGSQSLGGLSGDKTGCLDRAGVSYRKFLEGQASDREVSEIWNCAIQSLKLFSERTRGEQEGVYSPGELRTFMQKYFLKRSLISDELLSEGMELKRALIGGSVNELTQQELKQAMRILETFKEQTNLLRPLMPLNAQRIRSLSPEETDFLVKSAVSMASVLGRALQNTGIPYSFSHLEQFLIHLEKFHSNNESADAVESGEFLQAFREKMPLLRAIKGALISPGGERIGGNEWALVFETTARWLGWIVRVQQWVASDVSILQSPGRERFLLLSNEFFVLMDLAVKRHPGQLVAFAEFDSLIDAALPQGLDIQGRGVVSGAHLKEGLRILICRVFGGDQKSNTGRDAVGLTHSALLRTWRLLENWSEGQRYLEALFRASLRQGLRVGGESNKSVDPLHSLQKSSLLLSYPISRLEERAWLKPYSGVPGAPYYFVAGPSALASAAARLRKTIASEHPYFGTSGIQIRFDGPGWDDSQSFNNLSQLNWISAIVRAVSRGYIEDPLHSLSEQDDDHVMLTLPEFSKLILDFRNIALDLAIFDPQDPTIAKNRFRESNLFTFSGNGDEYLTIREGTQEMSMMISAKVLGLKTHSDAQASGCKSGEFDIYRYRSIDPDCYREWLFTNLKSVLQNFPQFTVYFESLEPEAVIEFKNYYELSARKSGVSTVWMNSADSDGFSMLPHYVEVLFDRFDKDRSGALGLYEARAAFPLFRSLLADLTCQIGSCLTLEKDLEAVFTFLLAYGHSPSKSEFVQWRYFPDYSNVVADRTRIIQIFAMIAHPPTP